METLEAISHRAADEAEQCVRESVAIDYAWKTGRLGELLDKKFATAMEAAYGDDSGSTGG